MNTFNNLDKINIEYYNENRKAVKNMNFIGWKAEIDGNIDEETLNYFKNKLWLPGEYLPKINFNITFSPVEIQAKKEVQVVKIGDKVEVEVIKVDEKGRVDLKLVEKL